MARTDRYSLDCSPEIVETIHAHAKNLDHLFSGMLSVKQRQVDGMKDNRLLTY
jgi:hypothetical protein